MLRLLVAAVALNGFAGERIVHLDEMDHLANRTALFNAGASVEEARYGVLMLHLATTNRVSCHKRFFPISVAPEAKDWTLSFRFRFDAKDAARELGLKLYFGDPKNPETRLLTMREEGSFFEGGAKPSAPQEGMAGFLYGYGESGYGAWNSAAITVSDGAATCWTMRGGKYVADGTGTFPAKPLVGWNLVATAEKTDFRFDRLMVTDGRAVPYERGDLQEAIAELRKEPPPAWDAAFGAPMKSGEDIAADLAREDLSVRFRAPFRRATKTAKAVGCAFELVYGDKKSERIAFGAGDITGEAKYRVFKGGKFVETSVKTTISNCVLTATGSRLGMHTVPPIRHWGGYETEEINELIAAQDAFRKPAERTYELQVVRDGENAYRVSLDGQLLKTVKTAAPVTAVRFSGDAGAEARYAFSAAPGRAPEKYELAVKKGGFKLERVRENLGTFMLECNHYLSRDGFEQMPSSCLWNVPRKQWARAKARCRIDPTAPPEHVPVITARLTHFYDNGGRSIAMCQETVDLSKDDSRVVKQGDEYEVTFDFDIASIMDLTSMTDGCTRAELPFLHFEFTGPLWEKNRYYIDAGRSPAEELRSSVIVLGGSLEESPVWFRATPERPYSLYYPGETPKVNVEFRPVRPGKYAVDVDVRQNDGDWKAERCFRLEGSEARRETVSLPTAGGLGLYTVSYRVTDEAGTLLQKYETSYGLLPENTREAGYDSPYYSWNFRGAHGTAPRFEDWAPAYDYLGVKRTLLDPNPRMHLMETNAQIAAHGFTHAEFPFICPRDDSEKAKEEAKKRMRSYVDAYPHCKQALIFHESGGGPFPKELYGEKTELSDWAKTHQSNRVLQATRAIKCWREVDPSVKMIVGNSGESYGLIAELMRGGLDKSLVDSWGEESVGLTMPPEMTTAYTPWCIKRLAKIYGYPETMDCPWEWKCRTERYERSFRGAAAVNLRDDLIAHALGYKTIPVGCGTETANSYADTIWCSGTFSRWPMAYPRENALAVATQTLVLDRAKYRRQLKTGSLTAYALEFEAKDGKWIYALWTSRGETTMKIEWSNGGKILGFIPWAPDYEIVTMLGRRSESDAETVVVGDEPVYLISKDTIDFFETAKRRTFRHENPAALAANREVLSLASAADVTLDFSEDCRIDPKFDSTPFRPGKFAAKTVTDDEKGACIELTHLSQADCPEIMQEYVFLKIKEPKTIAQPFDTIGIWAKGNSNWGRVSFEITDAEGEKWYSSGLGGVGCYVYDWPAKLAFNYDGWNFLQAPLTGKSDVKITGPGENQWLWTRDGSGNSRIDWPVKVTAIGISQYGGTLDLLEMKASEPSIRLGCIEVR